MNSAKLLFMSQITAWIRVGAVGALFCSAVQAQFDNNWLTFAPGAGRLKTNTGADATAILTDPQEKDFASGDVNNDGWVDVVMVRKLPFTVAGGFPNFLLMNEGGILVDRSGEYASESSVAGDNGFLTPTNDRDVVLSDVNLDGWLDIITCTTMSDGLPKHISHPRVYINKGSVNGQWQGFRFEDARMPAFSIAPRFCGVDAGDVTGDGAPDLYFADYGGLEDKLLQRFGHDAHDRFDALLGLRNSGQHHGHERRRSDGHRSRPVRVLPDLVQQPGPAGLLPLAAAPVDGQRRDVPFGYGRPQPGQQAGCDHQ
jgi:hypothetical protein